MLAIRVASERGTRLGGEVGYQIRLDNVSSRDTRILFVTRRHPPAQNAGGPGTEGHFNPLHL